VSNRSTAGEEKVSYMRGKGQLQGRNRSATGRNRSATDQEKTGQLQEMNRPATGRNRSATREEQDSCTEEQISYRGETGGQQLSSGKNRWGTVHL
jgi:hypothetical protein